MLNYFLVEHNKPKQATNVVEYYEEFEEWRNEMLALKPELSEEYFIDGFNFGLDWNIQMKLKRFRSPPKILYEAYLRAKIEEAVMEKHDSALDSPKGEQLMKENEGVEAEHNDIITNLKDESVVSHMFDGLCQRTPMDFLEENQHKTSAREYQEEKAKNQVCDRLAHNDCVISQGLSYELLTGELGWQQGSIDKEIFNSASPLHCPRNWSSVSREVKQKFIEILFKRPIMMIIGYRAIARPTFSLVICDVPAISFCKPQLYSSSMNGCRFMRFSCSVSGRTVSSTSLDLSLSKDNSGNEGLQRQKASSSLYAHPSLSQIRSEKAANRAPVYDFLRGIGVFPDELDGLELPVTVDVMCERVDFLHRLGLTVEDINNYPLVLGYSVKKNMVPVLDYLGKLGVKKSTFTEFLRRYPQVLHSSVVVDLAPVVKYLQGMDIKPNDIPRVLEKYPEVLGFKLEGTMSTLVAYLVGIGVARREIGGLLTRYPQILGVRVGRTVKPFVDYLESLGIPQLAIARLIEKRPFILGFGLEDRIKPNVESLLEFNVRKSLLASVIAQYPEIIGVDVQTRLCTRRDFLNSIIQLDPVGFGRVVEKMPQIVSLNNTAILKHLDFLKECGFSLEQVRKMVMACPQLLALNLDVMKVSFDYFQGKMARPLDDLVSFPAFFTYGLESTIKPRHAMIGKKGLKCSLAWFLNCSDEKFEERMTYDTIDIEEMEVESSFDMNSLLGTRTVVPISAISANRYFGLQFLAGLACNGYIGILLSVSNPGVTAGLQTLLGCVDANMQDLLKAVEKFLGLHYPDQVALKRLYMVGGATSRISALVAQLKQKNQQALPFSYTTCLLRIAKYQSEDFVWKLGTLFDILEDKDCLRGRLCHGV
ncbi:uncharacterized protein [Coffea arabica]|uniref:Transcription termination factor MTERF4, chloroplastic-like n=1 Tax=Coffea arabica TaxID=13443 RepID=A0ABM4UI00_COFAR